MHHAKIIVIFISMHGGMRGWEKARARARADLRVFPALTHRAAALRQREIKWGEGEVHMHMQNQVKPPNWRRRGRGTHNRDYVQSMKAVGE